MAAGRILCQVKSARLMMGANPLFDGVDVVLSEGERACLVGDNGVGKSTLMRMIAGAIEPDDGDIVFASGATLAFAMQEPDLSGFDTLRTYVQSPSVTRAGSMAPLPPHEADAALMDFDLDPDRSPQGLSGGEVRRASLARVFAAAPDILLLDEPTNHLDIPAIEALEEKLAAFRGAALVISHDRRFLEDVSTATVWIRKRKALKSERGFAAFDDWAERIEAEEQRALAKLETHLAAEEHWLRRGVTARRSRNEGRRRKLEAMRAERRERIGMAHSPRAGLGAEKGDVASRLVIEAKGLTKSYADRPIVCELNLRVLRGDRIGVVGANGAGKTTLLEMLLGHRDPDSGSVRVSKTVEIAYVDQNRAILTPRDTIWEALAPQGGDQVMVRGRPRHVAGYAKEFLFDPTQLRQPIGSLSGGERNRLALAVSLTRKADLLVLDEPTNDLDMDTLDALEDMLAQYEGTVLIVSHDRAFLDGVTTQILGATGAGKWVETPGGWRDFEREHGGFRPAGTAAPKEAVAQDTRAPRVQKKLSFKDEHRAAEVEKLLPKLEAEIATLEEKLADNSFFSRDPLGFNTAVKRLDAARAEKDQAEEDWLNIEARREALSAEP
ncbi:MAG: ABC-F family ATP-binding cassette domain-containing protein [Caulobacterales bacterium]